MPPATPPKRPGIADVARASGVSIATVSRVLNGSDQVSDRRRAAVRRAVAELGYRPNEAARALVSGRNRIVGVLAADTRRTGHHSTIQGVQEAAGEHGLIAAVSVVRSEDPADVTAAVELLLKQPLAGIVGIEFDDQVTAALQRLPSTLHATSARRIGSRVSHLPHGHIDDELAARLATEHLLDLGHETVHHLSVGPPPEEGRGRTAGWRRTLEEHGRRVPEPIPVSWDPASSLLAARDVLPADATALLCFNDETALGALRGLAEAGRRVPDDLSVVGFDDDPVSRLLTPSLTSVRMDWHALGRLALEQLVARIEGRPAPDDVALPPVLVPRESSAPPPGRG
ncbi:LacI family DNA-binding transcriptional regulator [Frigoribacterium salinisoli]